MPRFLVFVSWFTMVMPRFHLFIPTPGSDPGIKKTWGGGGGREGVAIAPILAYDMCMTYFLLNICPGSA